MNVLRIATWNVARPSFGTQRAFLIIEALKKREADIFVLTETYDSIIPDQDFFAYTTPSLLKGDDGVDYKNGEKRCSVFSRFPFTKAHPTYNPKTAACTSVETPLGDLIIYGSILGIFGKGRRLKEEIILQQGDIRSYPPHLPVCMAGDFNTSFSDNYYYSKTERNLLSAFFEERKMLLLTASIPENIDHIAISESFLPAGYSFHSECWNEDKKLSDHKGVEVTISY